MLIFEEKIYFYLLFLVIFFVLFFIFVINRKRKNQLSYASLSALKKIAPERSFFKSWVKFGFFLAIFTCIVMALVNPKMGTKLQKVKREGVDIVFAVDVSKSMLCQDVAPNRLEKSKNIISEVINTLGGDRIGLVAYAGTAYGQLPLTTDYTSAKMFLQNFSTDMLSSQGTAIAEAIEMSVNYFDLTSPTAKVLFIISDGEDHESGTESSIKKAKENGIFTYTIGIGTPKGGTIPDGENTFKKNEFGEIVITKLNEELLKNIAKTASGAYFNGNHTKQVLQNITKTLEGIEKQEYEAETISDYKDHFQWFLAFAVFFIILDFFIFERKTFWVKKINLFGEKNQPSN